MTTLPSLDSHLERFRRLDGTAPPAVRALRERGLERFAELGLPTTRLEDWKYTDVGPLARQPFQLAEVSTQHAVETIVGQARLGSGIELVFVNGHYAASLSNTVSLPAGVVVGSLAAALREHARLVEPHLGRYAPFERPDDSLTALNTAFLHDGAFVSVPDGAELEAPVHCVFLSFSANGPVVAHPRNLIVVGAGARVTVIEHYVGSGVYWTNAATEAALSPGATLTHYAVQRQDARAFHTSVVAADQAADSVFTSRAVSLGASLARTDIATRLDAPGASCTFDGLYLATDAQHVDHHTTIDHRQPRGTSRELYKGILAGHATGVFNGKVFVRPRAQQSDAQQMNKNLLLSDDAQIDTKPQLEILADDVKCSHGATIGQLDDDAVFYLRARGIDDASARQMLIVAFANELVDRVDVAPLREQLSREIETRLQGASA